MPLLFKRISGVKGQIIIPDLDAVVARMEKWELTRRGGDTGSHRYDLRAVFSYVNPVLMADTEYSKEIRIIIGRNTELRAQMSDGEETVLNGRALLIKGVNLHERR